MCMEAHVCISLDIKQNIQNQQNIEEINSHLLSLGVFMYDDFYFWCKTFQMVKYSKHLESIVAERTQDLVHEKQKTDRLLYSELLI